MTEPFHFLIPAPPPANEVFATHQLAWEFRHEVQQRQAHQDYCDWYAQVARQHQQELVKMQGDWNLFGWFMRR
ncbi:MAG: hypothetical protein F6J87_16925 [Spirulina sp. SIO3F2]|nr:hypothetical protein [Spirulina sp. SIO3F2]